LYKFLDGYELLQIFIAMVAEVCDIGHGYIKEPYHDIISFFINFEGDVNPEGHHGGGEGEDDAAHDEGEGGVEVELVGVVYEGGVDAVYVVYEHGGYGCDVFRDLEVAHHPRVQEHNRVLQVFDSGEVVLEDETDTDIAGEGDGVVEVLLVEAGVVAGAVHSVH
jgi:hypothetical protein